MSSPTPPAQAHSATSQEAARAIKPRVPEMRNRVLEALKAAPGTDQQIAQRTGMPENSVRPRRVELQRLGLVIPFGVARTTSGRRAQQWVVAGHTYGLSASQVVVDEPGDPFALRPCVACGKPCYRRYCSDACAIREDGEPIPFGPEEAA